MGHLELRFDKQHLGAEVNLGVVARVRQIKDATGRFPEDPEDREVVIPAGQYTKRILVDVPAGTYRIEARLPSGEVLRKTRTVTDDLQAAEVVFEADHSPHEWLSWQRFAGNVPSQKEYEYWITHLAEQIIRAAKAKEDAAKPIEIDQTTVVKLAGVVRSVHSGIQRGIRFLEGVFTKRRQDKATTTARRTAEAEPAPAEKSSLAQAAANAVEFELIQVNPLTAGDVWNAVASLGAWSVWRRTAIPSLGCTVNRVDDRQITLWQIEQRDRVGSSVIGPSGEVVPLRILAVLRRGDGVDVIPLPIPWPLDPNLPATGIEILREAGPSESGRTAMTVRDDVVGSLLMYLNNGQLADAATVFAEANRTGLVEQLMSEKSQNPLAACAAAYVGFATLSGDGRPRWAPWLENLKNLFKWVPDGAIVHAAYLIRTAENRNDLDTALASLKEAYRRGIPFYTSGLQYLMNGLYTFSERDAEAKAMYEKVRTVAAHVDPGQAFNQITIGVGSSS